MKIVSNTTPIISLASIGKLDLLKKLFREIIIAKAVYNEIKVKEGFGYEEVESEFIKVKSIKGQIYRDLLLNQLDVGEAETIILAKENGIIGEIKPLLDDMISKGRWYSKRVYESFLSRAGEL
ncbi:MAG: DUF3368 domain-containing protein [bacterium]